MSGGISRTVRKLAHCGPKRCMVAGAGVAGLLLATSCNGAGTAHQAVQHPSANVTITSGNVTFSSAASGAGALHAAGSAHAAAQLDTRPDLGVRVAAQHGTLTSVTVRNSDGHVLPGSYGGGASSWQTTASGPAAPVQVTRLGPA